MVVGNIIGSNIFNTVAVLAIPGLISPVAVQEEIKIDYLVMLGLTIFLYLFFLIEFVSKQKETISRLEGFVLIMILSTYIYFRFLV
jgi:cation:H+ antiporter